MKVAKDTFFIHVNSDRNANIGITGANGSKIIIDTDYNRYKHTVQIGKIYACPIGITDQYINDVPLNVGDTVVFHHFVCQPDHKVNIGENVYRAEYFHLYAKLIGGTSGKYEDLNDVIKMQPIEDIIFVEPILEDESNLYAGKLRIKTYQERIKQEGIVFACSKKAQSLGIQAGDKVFFTANADYSMKVASKDLYRMRIRNIIAIERNGELLCLKGRILIKQLPEERLIGRFTDVGATSIKKGVICGIGEGVLGLELGLVVSYVEGALGGINWNGSPYSMIETRHINYIIG